MAANGRIVLGTSSGANVATNFHLLSFGGEAIVHPAINTTNLGTFQITHSLDRTGTNTVGGAKFDIINNTNQLLGATAIMNLSHIGSVPTATKSITNTWYSRTSDNTDQVTNIQVYINGVLTSWKQNGTEL